jgi:hypothetical protein
MYQGPVGTVETIHGISYIRDLIKKKLLTQVLGSGKVTN